MFLSETCWFLGTAVAERDKEKSSRFISSHRTVIRSGLTEKFSFFEHLPESITGLWLLQWWCTPKETTWYKREDHTRTMHHWSWCFSFTQMASSSFFSEICELCLPSSIIKGHNGGWGSWRDLDTPGSSLLDLLICYLTPVRVFLHLKKGLCFLNPKIKTKPPLCLGDQRSISDNKAEK